MIIALAYLLALPCAAAQQATQTLDFPSAVVEDPAALSGFMPVLAVKAIAAYKDDDRDRYLDNLFRLQGVAGRYSDADQTLVLLRELRRSGNSEQAVTANVRWEIYAKARSRQIADKLSFDEAFKRSFREAFGRLDDKTAYDVLWSFGTSLNLLQNRLRDALDRQKGKETIALPDAVNLLRTYFAAQAFGSFQPMIADLTEENDQLRYVVDKDILVRTPDGANICALVVRPRVSSTRLTALLNFTIYSDSETKLAEARLTAANGYAAVEGFTRGKGCSPDKPVPIEHDGTDAATLIDWIARQSWSDGRVGMYGGSYEGFTQWAAAKHMPKALKALMPSVTFAPGIDFPMAGSVFQNYGFPWPFYTTNLKTLDNETYNDSARWNKLNHDWYASGRAYRDLDKMYGTPNPIWNRWVSHPGYDRYWQNMIPYREEFARINIPVLTTTGYYDDGQVGALYYFRQHYTYNSRAEHYLIIGPYDHVGGQRGTRTGPGGGPEPLLGYTLDPVAAIDIGALRYQWFNHVFKGGPKPALLKDKVNYEVMGANAWKHAPSLAAMAAERMRFHLSATHSGDAYRLLAQHPAKKSFISQSINLADRSTGEQVNFAPANVDNWNGNDSIITRKLGTTNGFTFVSEPFPAATEVSGLFSGRLSFITNKKDFDFNVQLYELTPGGEYVQLSYYWARASYVRDRSRRQLLVPNRRQQFDFESNLMTSRQFQPGSRLVVMLRVIKRADMQINYGTGKDVSDETIEDAGELLRIKWFGDSFIEIPVSR